MMKTLLSGLIIAAVSTSAFAQSPTNISFEATEGYTLGEIHQQQDWSYWGESIILGTGMVTTADFSQGSQSLNVISNGFMDYAGVEKAVNGYAVTEFSCDFKIEDVGGSDYFIAAYDAAYATAAMFNISYQSGAVSIFEPATESYLATNFSATPGTWNNFKMIVNLNNYTAQFYFNNQLCGTASVDPAVTGFNVIDFAYDDYGTGFTVDNIVVQQPTASIGEVVAQTSINVFPNPTTDFVNITTDATINQVEVVDLNGKVVLTDKSGNNSVNLSTLAAGNYIVKVDSSKGALQTKIIKN